MISKKDYEDIFLKNAMACVECYQARSTIEVPKKIRFSLGVPEIYEKAISDGFIKYLGGRKLEPGKLRNLSVGEVANFTFVNGQVPVWINLYFESNDDEYSYIRVLTSNDLSSETADLYSMPGSGRQFRIIIPVDGEGAAP